MSWATGPRVVIGRGPRAVEKRVLTDLLALAAEALDDPRVLARPVVVVVPSRSLREHLLARLVARACHPVAGVTVLTLRGLARRVLERAREGTPSGGVVLSLLVARAARGEPALAERLESLADGYESIAGTVRDLLDAGYEPEAHAETLTEVVHACSGRCPQAELGRAEALLRLAGRVAAEMAALGVGRTADLLRRTTDLLRADPDLALPTRAVLVHGFAEAIGVATDLVEVLMRHLGAVLYLDEPPDPANPEQPDLGREFMRPLLERTAGIGGVERIEDGLAPPRLELIAAPGCEAEARETARRVRRLLDSDAKPEGIGVVARDLGPYQAALVRHLGRLAVPFCAPHAPGMVSPAVARVRAFGELLRLGTHAGADAFVQALALPERHRHDVRLALRAYGVSRLAELLRLDVPALLGGKQALPLPLRHGLAEEAGDDGDGPRTVAPRRTVAGNVLAQVTGAARATAAALLALARPTAAPAAVARVRDLATDTLSWTGRTDNDALDALDRLAEDLPSSLVLDGTETAGLVAHALEKVGRCHPGGSGGGVAVLGVVEARARIFDHLFLLGLNRDSFPRLIREDPALPDAVRRQMLVALPDLPLKHRGFDEERFLFAELVASSPDVTLSWQACDDDGKERPVSPLVQRLLLASHVPEPLVAAPAVSDDPGSGIRPAHERAVLAGLAGARDGVSTSLAVALADTGVANADTVASSRAAVLDELDPDWSTPEGRERRTAPGPYLGFVGPAGPERARNPAVTTLETLARCPWQVLLTKILRLERSPDPLAVLPGIDQLLLGTTVHRVLERLCRGATPGPWPESVEQARGVPPRPVPWPDEDPLASLVAGEAVAAAREAGLTLPGLHRALAVRVLELLQVARRQDWATPPDVVALEAEGAAEVTDDAGRPRRVLFRVDRVDRSATGLRLTDYKTGRGPEAHTGAGTRRKHLLKDIATGKRLQGAAYAAAAGPGGAGGYLFLREEKGTEGRIEVGGEDVEARECFLGTARALLASWDSGALFPRLSNPAGSSEGDACRWCEVGEACLHGDSGARWRLEHMIESLTGQTDLPPALEACRRVWRLPTGSRDEEAPR